MKDKEETTQKGKTNGRTEKRRIQAYEELFVSDKHFWNVNDSIISILLYNIQFSVIPQIIMHFVDKPVEKQINPCFSYQLTKWWEE